MNQAKLKSIKHAHRLLRQTHQGVLSTHSKANEGFPFGSVSTFISNHVGEPIFYISDLAQHTKNINYQAKMCFTVFHNNTDTASLKSDPNAEARLSLLGQAQIVEPSASCYDAIRSRFYALHPKSQAYQKTHDFAFYKMSIERARFIGGFGDIHWFSKEQWQISSPEWAETEISMVKHMNEDHQDAMQLICQQHQQQTYEQVSMLAVDPDGAHYLIDNTTHLFVPFKTRCHTGNEVRQELVRQTQVARASALANDTSNQAVNH